MKFLSRYEYESVTMSIENHLNHSIQEHTEEER